MDDAPPPSASSPEDGLSQVGGVTAARFEAARGVVLSTLADLNREWGLEALLAPTEETRLFGAKSGVDSLMLVTLLAELEARVDEQLGQGVILADERAMSAARSPFRRVGTLIEHLAGLLEDSEAEASPT